VYTRFESKAELLQRCLDVAIGGVDQVLPVEDDSWVGAAMWAPTAAERIALMARATAELMDRTGALRGVAQRARAATEPAIAARAQAARLDTQRVLEGFWRRMEADGLRGWPRPTPTRPATGNETSPASHADRRHPRRDSESVTGP
jgi:hypothetical protein